MDFSAALSLEQGRYRNWICRLRRVGSDGVGFIMLVLGRAGSREDSTEITGTGKSLRDAGWWSARLVARAVPPTKSSRRPAIGLPTNNSRRSALTYGQAFPESWLHDSLIVGIIWRADQSEYPSIKTRAKYLLIVKPRGGPSLRFACAQLKFTICINLFGRLESDRGVFGTATSSGGQCLPAATARAVALDARSRLPLDSVRFCMIFEPESASATAVKPGVAVLVEDAAGTLLLGLRRDCELWGLPGGRPAEHWTTRARYGDQPHALPHLLLRRRHRLPGLVPGARRRGAGHGDRQVLLHHLPLSAAVLRAPLAAGLFQDRGLPARRRDPASGGPRRCWACCGVERGLEIHHDGDLPARSGMGSSSAFTVGFLHAMYGLLGRLTSQQQLAAEAIHVEQDLIGETVGAQDQIFASFGGFNCIEFKRDGSFRVEPLTLAKERLEELNGSLMLFYTGLRRTASEVAASYVTDIGARSQTVDAACAQMVDEGMKILAGNGSLDAFGDLLDEAWRLKRSLSGVVSNTQVDEHLRGSPAGRGAGRQAAGRGGRRLCAAFMCPPACQQQVKERLRGLDLGPFPVRHQRQPDHLLLARSGLRRRSTRPASENPAHSFREAFAAAGARRRSVIQPTAGQAPLENDFNA